MCEEESRLEHPVKNHVKSNAIMDTGPMTILFLMTKTRLMKMLRVEKHMVSRKKSRISDSEPIVLIKMRRIEKQIVSRKIDLDV